MRHPYQSVCVAQTAESNVPDLLVAACGSELIASSMKDGAILSQWSIPDTSSQEEAAEPADEGPPGKKRKISASPESPSNIIKLALSADQRYVVAVTGGDKCIRVLEIVQPGKLVQLSQRCMPKRPCAIEVTPDNQNILCSDKFGDVYSLPLLETDQTGHITARTNETNAAKKAFTPSANTLTVHSMRNRKALENQLKQKDLTPKSKEPLKFEHQLLLGHVSMLTDMKVATREVNGKTGTFIITADRDEHIRISRGLPQAHIIERYCLGHTEFISRICVVPDTNLLVSAGGDDWLGVWDWTTGELLSTRDIKTALQSINLTAKGLSLDQTKVTVSGLWCVPATRHGKQTSRCILVALEGIPTLFAYDVEGASVGQKGTPLDVPHAVLDVAGYESSIIISFEAYTDAVRLEAYTVVDEGGQFRLDQDESLGSALKQVNALATVDADEKVMKDLFYGVENLRKRGGVEEEPEAEAV